MDALRLFHMFYIDASHKKGVAETMTAEAINRLYVMKSETGMTASILPTNDNAHVQEIPRMTLLKSFRENERETIDNVVVQPVVDTPLSSQKIKTYIFSNAVTQILQLTPIQNFTLSAEIKSKPVRQEAAAIEMEPDYSGTNVVPLFPTRAYTLAS